jgi:hypothetical protein
MTQDNKHSEDERRVHNPPTLEEIQIRAYRVHWQHGGVYGGYSLDDWLEAEHELDSDTGSDSNPDSND